MQLSVGLNTTYTATDLQDHKSGSTIDDSSSRHQCCCWAGAIHLRCYTAIHTARCLENRPTSGKVMRMSRSSSRQSPSFGQAHAN